MKFVVISDTHGLHRHLMLPKGDVLIHAGDFCDVSDEGGYRDFLDWMTALRFKQKIFIGGNHDFFADKYPNEFLSLIPDGLTYLNDSGMQVGRYKLWGSPISPDLVSWAFGRRRGEDMQKHWDLIPSDTDILITHTPPFGILDKPSRWGPSGCKDLLKKLETLELKAHIFGHIHASYGQVLKDGVRFINGSNIQTGKGIVNKAIRFSLP